MLDPIFGGVSSCLRCEGVWLSPAALGAGFGSPGWPGDGKSLWWRNALECPECAFEGISTAMAARISRDVMVDECPRHGLWLDRGEIGRLMGTATDELEALRARLSAIAPDLEHLVARREKWRTDVEIRRKAALDYRQAVEDEQLRRARLSESERMRFETEGRDRAQAATADTQLLPAPRRTGARSSPPSPATPAESSKRAAKRRQSLGTTLTPVSISSEAAEQAARRRGELATQRDQAAADVTVLQGRLVALEDHVRRIEAQLVETRQHAASVREELDAARAALRTLDEQLDGAR
jgi:Zn-finger nucleic acid-binding protein